MLLLASKSPRRQELLTKYKIDFKVVESDYEEDHSIESDPHKLALAHAKNKAQGALKNASASDIILAADTLVTVNGQILNKPLNENEARKMLSQLSGQTHTVITAVALLRVSDEKLLIEAVESKVTFKELSHSDIDEYIETNEWTDKAGAYAIQGEGAHLIADISGSYENVIGLPVLRVDSLYKELL